MHEIYSREQTVCLRNKFPSSGLTLNNISTTSNSDPEPLTNRSPSLRHTVQMNLQFPSDVNNTLPQIDRLPPLRFQAPLDSPPLSSCINPQNFIRSIVLFSFHSIIRRTRFPSNHAARFEASERRRQRTTGDERDRARNARLLIPRRVIAHITNVKSIPAVVSAPSRWFRITNTPRLVPLAVLHNGPPSRANGSRGSRYGSIMQMHKHIICLYHRGEILAYSGTRGRGQRRARGTMGGE